MPSPRRSKRAKPAQALTAMSCLATTIHSPELLQHIFLYALSLTNGRCRVQLAGVSKDFHSVVQSRVLIYKSMVGLHGSLFLALQHLLTLDKTARCKTGLIVILEALASFVRYPQDLDSISMLRGTIGSNQPHLERLLWTRSLSTEEESNRGVGDATSIALGQSVRMLRLPNWYAQFSSFLAKHGEAVGGW